MNVFHVTLEQDDNDTLLVQCPDIPMLATFGETEAEALAHAVDAIEHAIASMIHDGEDIPAAKFTGGVPVRLPLLTVLKVELYQALRTAGLTRADLTRRLGWNRNSVDRLFQIEHASRLEQLDAAFRALGREVDVRVTRRDAA